VQTWLAWAALAVAVIAVPISILATRQWGSRRARLEVSVSATPLLPEDSHGLLQVTFRDIAAEKPHLVSVALRNTWPRDIATGTFVAGRSIAVRFNQTFFGLTGTEGGIDAVFPAIGASGEDAVVNIRPGLLKREQAWSFSAVTTGPVDVAVDAPLIDTDVREATSTLDRPEITLRVSMLGISAEMPLRLRSARR
jgi:hypothetical protein